MALHAPVSSEATLDIKWGYFPPVLLDIKSLGQDRAKTDKLVGFYLDLGIINGKQV